MQNKSQMAPELVYRNEAILTSATIYSTLELSERVVVLGLTPRNLRDNPGGAAKRNRSSPGSNPQFFEHFSVNLARSAKIDNSSVHSGEQSDFSHKIIKSNV